MDTTKNGRSSFLRSQRKIKLGSTFLDLRLAKTKRKEAVPESSLERYPLLSKPSELKAHAEVLEWLLTEKKLDARTIETFQLRLYTDDADAVGVVFPILGLNGQTTFDLWAMTIADESLFHITPQMSHANIEYRASELIFGNHLLDRTKPLILTQGPLNALRLHTLGIKRVMAYLDAPSSKQLRLMSSPIIYLAFDYTKAGRLLAKTIAGHLHHVEVALLNWGIVGKKSAQELKNLDEFKSVFTNRVKIVESVPEEYLEDEEKARTQQQQSILAREDGTFF